MKAGTAYADLPDSGAAAAQATREAHERAGGGPASLVLCFHHGRHDVDAIRSAIGGVVGPDVPVAGGTAMGVMTNDALGYEGHQIGVAVVCGEGIDVLSEDGLRTDGEFDVGRRLGAKTDPERDLLLLYSSIRSGLADAEGLSLFFGTPLLAGMQSGGTSRSLAGAGLLDSLQPSSSHVIAPQGALREGVVALSIGDGLRMDSSVLHGCRPAGAYHRITETEGPLVLGIDDRPALDVIDELMGGDMPYDEYPFRVILGLNRGERFGEFDPEAYQTRLCLAVVPERRALVMFEPDLAAGDDVQLMRISRDFGYIEEAVRTLIGRLDGRRPVLAIYADCAGRCMAASPLEAEEGDAVRAALGEIPLLGFYSGVEVGRVGGEVRPLDWTGVLCIISA